ncbi:MAG: nitroreductase [Candidatus Thermoplasmatota archaeon]|nr:nitroreductase [Candidatus Thermoplasmatota archaeon]
MSNLQDLINSRRSIYKFTDEVVNRDIVEQALVAASNAPSHKHTHPWKFYIIGADVRKRLVPVITRLAEVKSAKLQSTTIELDRQRAIDKIIQPPILIAVSSKKSPNDKFREKEDYAASVCALHNMVLSLWDNGVGAQWSTGSITRDQDTYDILSIDSRSEEIIGFVKAGYPEKIRQVRKKPLEEIVKYLD